MSVADEHRAHAPAPAAVRVATVTVSDSRTPATDEGGRLIRELCQAAGFEVVDQALVPDERGPIADRLRGLVAEKRVDAVLFTGGTGLSPRDVTVEAVAPLFDKTLPGFGELFRALSFAEVGPAAMLSRATAGSIGTVAVFLLPGSPSGVRLALERLIIPELGHIVAQLRRQAAGHHGHRHHEHHHKPRG